MRIQHNIPALNSYRQLGGNNNALAKNLEKLSSGYKINRAGDDAAGLAISEKMRAQITGLEKAQDNANDGISLVQTAEGALTEVHSMLNRMVELATQSANGTYDDSVDRANLQKEVASLKDEIDRISESTNFNGLNLLDGSLGGPKAEYTEGSIVTMSATIGGNNIKMTEATGNTASYTAPTQGAAGQVSELMITYDDATGTSKTAKVSVTTGADAAATNAAIADAINKNADLGKLFEAKVDDAGELVISTKETGADVQASVTNITHAAPANAAGTGGFTSVNGKAAVAITGKTGTNFADGDAITYKGADGVEKTIVFNSTGQAGTVGNTTTCADKASFQAALSTATGQTVNDTATIDATLLDNLGEWSVTNTGAGTITGNSATKAVHTLDPATMNITASGKAQLTIGGEDIVFDATAGDNAKTAESLKAAIEANTTLKGAYDVKVDGGKVIMTAKTTGPDTTVTTAAPKAFTDGITGGMAAGATTETAEDAKMDLTNGAGGTPAFADGDKIVLDGKTYTFKAGADGSDGSSFSDLTTLQAAAEKNGIDVAGTWDNLTATKSSVATFDFDGRIGADMIGGTITIGEGENKQTFEFVKAGGKGKVEGATTVYVNENDTAEAIADAFNKALANGITSTTGEGDAAADVTWTTGAKPEANADGKNTIVKLTAGTAGSIDKLKVGFKNFGINLQVGDTNDDYQKVKVSVNNMDCESLGIDQIDISTQTGASEAIKKIKDAINSVSATRGDLGAVQNRLDHTINNLGVTTENLTAAESRIRDTDMAEEMMAYTKNNILVQAAQAMLAQANQVPQGILQLLQ